MKKLLSAGAVLSLALILGGCYGTEKPLFDAKAAVYPVPSGTHYIQYFDDGRGWKEMARGTVIVKDGWYVATNKGEENDPTTFLLKPWGKNFIAVNKTQNTKGEVFYAYGILKQDSGAFLEFGPQCSALGAAALKKKGLVDYKPGQEDACVPVNVAAVATIMQMVLDSGAKPDNKYVVVK